MNIILSLLSIKTNNQKQSTFNTMSEIKVPYILTCRVTGLQKAYTSKDFVARKIENYGGDEQAMINGYVTKEAKRLLKPFGENITETDVQGVITALNGTTNAKDVLALIKGGTLFLTKKVKVRAKTDEVKAAGASKKGRSGKNKKTVKKAVKKVVKKKATKKVAAPAPVTAEPAPVSTEVTTPVVADLPETIQLPPANA